MHTPGKTPWIIVQCIKKNRAIIDSLTYYKMYTEFSPVSLQLDEPKLEHTGLWGWYSKMDHQHTVNQISEKATYDKLFCQVSVAYEKAFDLKEQETFLNSLCKHELWSILQDSSRIFMQ